MSELPVPDGVIGAWALTASVLYAAWHEYTASNPRDAKALAAMGAAGAFSTVAFWIS